MLCSQCGATNEPNVQFCTYCGSNLQKILSKSIESPTDASAVVVNNTLVWWLAFTPIIGVVVAGLLAALTRKHISYFWWVTLILNIGLSMFDEQMLKKAGHDTEKMGGAWLVPVYLYKRAQVLNQNNAYFIVWTVLFVLTLLSDL